MVWGDSGGRQRGSWETSEGPLARTLAGRGGGGGGEPRTLAVGNGALGPGCGGGARGQQLRGEP